MIYLTLRQYRDICSLPEAQPLRESDVRLLRETAELDGQATVALDGQQDAEQATEL